MFQKRFTDHQWIDVGNYPEIHSLASRGQNQKQKLLTPELMAG
jgi:hypothetical protein